MRILSVAEKPSAAKQLASLLSDNTQHARQGLNRYCWNFDFTYPLNGEMCEMTMTAVLGHMMQWEFPKEYKNWANTQVESLFTARLERRVGEVRVVSIRSRLRANLYNRGHGRLRSRWPG